ncbi:hypothetical protein G6F50_016131 [Rhizopus delemar]|uniref:Uncharacterized protein n=1 Tax=Rhizopus delemar TaxID=936053 RepID=A0A9P6XUW5_9FUNG|nr:hypothetical protein G6F50_016131 [Rhizopus delemar]
MPLEPSSKRRHRRCSYRYLHHVRHLVIPPLPDRLGQRNRHRAGPVRRRGRAKRLHPAPRPDAGASAQRRSHLRADRRRVHLRQRFRAAGADGLVPLADDRRAVVRRRIVVGLSSQSSLGARDALPVGRLAVRDSGSGIGRGP